VSANRLGLRRVSRGTISIRFRQAQLGSRINLSPGSSIKRFSPLFLSLSLSLSLSFAFYILLRALHRDLVAPRASSILPAVH